MIAPQCRSIPLIDLLYGIDRNWSALIGIDRHWDQCHNFDWHWALIEGVLSIYIHFWQYLCIIFDHKFQNFASTYKQICLRDHPTGRLGCPSRTKFWSSDFCFAPKLNLGLDNFKLFFQNFPTSGSLTPMSSKICDGMGVRDPEVGRFPQKLFELFRPRVNIGRKQKDDVKNSVSEGHVHPRVDTRQPMKMGHSP